MQAGGLEQFQAARFYYWHLLLWQAGGSLQIPAALYRKICPPVLSDSKVTVPGTRE